MWSRWHRVPLLARPLLRAALTRTAARPSRACLSARAPIRAPIRSADTACSISSVRTDVEALLVTGGHERVDPGAQCVHVGRRGDGRLTRARTGLPRRTSRSTTWEPRVPVYWGRHRRCLRAVGRCRVGGIARPDGDVTTIRVSDAAVMSSAQARCRARDHRRSVDRYTAGWPSRPARPSAQTSRLDQLGRDG